MATFRFRLTGASFRQDRLRDLFDRYWLLDRESEIELNLRRESTNPHDPFAVRVEVESPREHGGGTVGYASREISEKLFRALELGRISDRARFAFMGVGGTGGTVWADVEAEVLPRAASGG